MRIGGSAALILRAAPDAVSADVRSVQVTGDFRSQRLSGGVDVLQEKKNEVAEVASGLNVEGPATVIAITAVASPE